MNTTCVQLDFVFAINTHLVFKKNLQANNKATTTRTLGPGEFKGGLMLSCSNNKEQSQTFINQYFLGNIVNTAELTKSLLTTTDPSSNPEEKQDAWVQHHHDKDFISTGGVTIFLSYCRAG
jgi:hypothetical protein